IFCRRRHVECQLCQIMSNYVDSIPEILLNVRNSTLLPDDEEAWLKALIIFFSNPTHKRYMASKSRWVTETLYSIDNTVLQLLELWQRYRRP
ncbi:TPA: glycosyltransferase, partial [Escherichia coli]